MDYARSMREKLSVEYVKEELLKTAYGNGDTFLARLDPRTLIGWYLFFGIVPWFIHNKTILTGFLLFTICHDNYITSKSAYINHFMYRFIR